MTIVNNAVINFSLQYIDFISNSKICASCASLIFDLFIDLHTVFHKAVLTYIFNSSVKWFLFSLSSPRLVFCIFGNSHSKGCEMICHCSFNLHFSGSDV